MSDLGDLCSHLTTSSLYENPFDSPVEKWVPRCYLNTFGVGELATAQIDSTIFWVRFKALKFFF